jgi:hypothetical protein
MSNKENPGDLTHNRTEVESALTEPTAHLQWRDGVLEQLVKVTYKHMHFTGDHFNYSTYERRDEWLPVPEYQGED